MITGETEPACVEDASHLAEQRNGAPVMEAGCAAVPVEANATKRGYWRQRTLHSWFIGRKPQRTCIAVDIDEVLAFFVPELCAFHNKRYGTRLQATDFHSYRFAEVWGGTDTDAIRKVHEFFRTPAFQELQPIPGAKQVLQSRLARFRFVVVTSRQLVIEQETRAWLDKHFSGIFEAIYLGNQWALHPNGEHGTGVGSAAQEPQRLFANRRRKSQVCKACGAAVLIDDLPHNLLDCSENGVFGVLFDFQGQYGWSKSPAFESKDIAVVHSWEAVGELLDRL
jgi:hypothetical protein